MIEKIEKISLCITRESKHFLDKEMNIELLDSLEIDTIPLTSHLALVDLINIKKFTIVISIEDTLLRALFNIFFSDGVNTDEKTELIDVLPDEIINTIVGLAIKDFPPEYKNLKLSIPYHLNNKMILNMLQQSVSKSLQILTCKGSFYCSVSSIKE